MVIGIGIDLVEIAELQTEIDLKKTEWIDRVFSETEKRYCQQQADAYKHFAGIFAAKEALLKALGTGWTDHADLKDIEIAHQSQGAAEITVSGSVSKTGANLHVKQYFLSITHTKNYAAAIVVLEA